MKSSKGVKWYIVAVPVLAVLLVICAMLIICVKRWGGLVGFQSLIQKPPRATQEEDPEPNPMEMVEPTNTNENYAHTELVTPSSAAQGDPMVHAKPPACLKPAHPLIPVK